MDSGFLEISPVLPSQDIDRDVKWYYRYAGFELLHKDELYAVLKRENLCIHLQWHADTPEDPLLGGSVIKIFVKDIEPLFREFVKRGTVVADKLRIQTPWNTSEFGFYDLNNNAVFIVQDL
ncbi:glyoxalase/bleomycin resistance/extradiol dioxygenase family protein [Gramella aestuarii]|uniref:Glyoxalase/bleomycin resistance/extradiol dioxygenase family protein n=2 Tax=Christiangramia aestuarii TaxID=1028746 RepID=A0A7K1LNU0_9FLAO|nr:glyoxalase/bleomycin resistance/extradiol dioxygenase family protein [Christiangramia aestuarii]